MFSAFIQENWLEFGSAIVGLISAVAGVIAFYASKKRSKVEVGLSITEAHKEIWSKFLENPKLSRVTDETANLKRKPVTAEEEGFVFLILSHLASTLNAIELRQHISPDGLAEDVHDFFSKPIPKDVAMKHFKSQPALVRQLLKDVIGK